MLLYNIMVGYMKVGLCSICYNISGRRLGGRSDYSSCDVVTFSSWAQRTVGGLANSVAFWVLRFLG